MEDQTRRRQFGTYSRALPARAILEGGERTADKDDVAYAFFLQLDDPGLQEVVREFQVSTAEKAGCFLERALPETDLVTESEDRNALKELAQDEAAFKAHHCGAFVLGANAGLVRRFLRLFHPVDESSLATRHGAAPK